MATHFTCFETIKVHKSPVTYTHVGGGVQYPQGNMFTGNKEIQEETFDGGDIMAVNDFTFKLTTLMSKVLMRELTSILSLSSLSLVNSGSVQAHLHPKLMMYFLFLSNYHAFYGLRFPKVCTGMWRSLLTTTGWVRFGQFRLG